MFGKYKPVKHTGTREEVILGLMREWWDISQDGMMRMHAQERETRRIEDRLIGMGLELRTGSGTDEGWLFAVRPPHGQTCDDSECFCEPEFKVWHEEGFEDGVGRWEQRDVYETVNVRDTQYITVGLTCWTCAAGRFADVVTGKEWVWVGPPSPVPVPKPDAVALKTFANAHPTVPALSLGYQGSPSSLGLPPPQIRVEPKEDPPATQVADRFKHLLDIILTGDDLIDDYNRMYSDASCEDGRVSSRGVEKLLTLLEGAFNDQKLLDGSVSDFFSYLDQQVRGCSEDEDEDEEDGDDWDDEDEEEGDEEDGGYLNG